MGYVGEALRELGAELRVVNLLAGETISRADVGSSDGLLVLGGQANAYNDEQYPQMPRIVGIISEFHLAEKPVLGICLGAQQLARALGESYRSNQGWEIGFTLIKVTEAGRKDPLLAGLGDQHRLMEMHQDSFELPAGAELLMTGENCVNQSFRVGSCSYGMQFHPECSPSIVNTWAQAILDQDPEGGRQKVERMLARADEYFPRQKAFSRAIAARWFELVRRQSSRRIHYSYQPAHVHVSFSKIRNPAT
jgi:GMP synthase-like glutamine amidotransferase